MSLCLGGYVGSGGSGADPKVVQHLPTEAMYVAQAWWLLVQVVCYAGKATELGTGSDARSDTRPRLNARC